MYSFPFPRHSRLHSLIACSANQAIFSADSPIRCGKTFRLHDLRVVDVALHIESMSEVLHQVELDTPLEPVLHFDQLDQRNQAIGLTALLWLTDTRD